METDKLLCTLYFQCSHSYTVNQEAALAQDEVTLYFRVLIIEQTFRLLAPGYMKFTSYIICGCC